MSIDHDSMTVIGFVVPVEEAFKKFIVKREDRFHMEPRWSHLTGEPIAPEKVIDKPGGFALVIDGDEYFVAEMDDECDAAPEIYANAGDDEATQLRRAAKLLPE